MKSRPEELPPADLASAAPSCLECSLLVPCLQDKKAAGRRWSLCPRPGLEADGGNTASLHSRPTILSSIHCVEDRLGLVPHCKIEGYHLAMLTVCFDVGCCSSVDLQKAIHLINALGRTIQEGRT